MDKLEEIAKDRSEIEMEHVEDRKEKRECKEYIFKHYIAVEVDGEKYYSHNGNICTADILERELNIFKSLPQLHFGQIFDKENDDVHVNINKISHQLTDIDIQKDAVYITIKILNTPYGNVLEKMIEEMGVDKLELYAHMMGTKDEDGITRCITHIFRFDIGLNEQK